MSPLSGTGEGRVENADASGSGRGQVDPAGMPRVTPRDPAQAEPNPSCSAVLLDAGCRVMRTARVKAAHRAEPWGEQSLIAANQSEQAFADHGRGSRGVTIAGAGRLGTGPPARMS